MAALVAARLGGLGNSVVLNGELLLVCDGTINDSLQRRSNMSSVIAGKELR